MSIRLVKLLMASGLLVVTSLVNADELKLETDEQKFSYAMGYAIGSQIRGQFGSNGDMEIVARALSDVLLGKDPLMSNDEIGEVLQAEQQKAQEREQQAAAEMQAKGDAALEAGKAFLAENAKKDGVVTTDSGLQYKVITAAEGKSPSASDTVVVHYRGTLLDGTEFDSSYQRNNPAEFSLGGIIPGWQEVLQLMTPGAKWEVFIPSHLAYGPRGAGGLIGPNETLIFEIELLEVK